MAYIIGRLHYNEENDRYGILVGDTWQNRGLHCGDGLEVMFDGKWICTRIESNYERQYYLVDTQYCGNLENIPVRIKQ